MSAYQVKVPRLFWQTLADLRPKYSHSEYVAVVNAVKDCIEELSQRGIIEESGWGDHLLLKPPFNDGQHREAHTYDDDVLVVYFLRERHHVIRMVGVFDHESIPNA